jgi:hypothetical protein
LIKAETAESGRHSVRVSWFLVWAVCVGLVPTLCHSQETVLEVPSTTPLSIQLMRHVPMKVGEPLDARLLYSVYAENRIALPGGTLVHGRLVQLDPDRKRRTSSRLRGDFTPFHIPVVQFDQLVLPDGTVQSFVSDSATDGAPILRLSPPPAKKKGSFISRQIAQEKQWLKDTVALFTAPGRGDRLVQFIYSQLPYHPERVESNTTWTVELVQPLDLRVNEDPQPDHSHPSAEHSVAGTPDTSDPPAGNSMQWKLNAYLQRTLSSAKERPGNTFQAVVSEPVLNAKREVEVPQGSILSGEITQAKAARSFGRQGKLRFRFRELRLPTGFAQPIDGTLSGVDANKSANLEVDSEGGVAPKTQNRIIVPLALTLLAGRALDDDGSQVAHSAVASNGFGIIGRVVGIAASSRNVAAGIGMYGAALAFYDLWLARGHDVVFVKDTRVEITAAPSRNSLAPPKIRESSPPH